MVKDEEDFDVEELAVASATEKYKNYLIDSFIDLMEMSEIVNSNMLQGRSDPEAMTVLNKFISRLSGLLLNFAPKIKGGGEKTKDLMERYIPYENWIKNPSLPMEDMKEADKIYDLLFLIRECFERFNLTSW